MAVLQHFLNSLSLSSKNLPSAEVVNRQQHHQFVWGNHRLPLRKLVLSASSTKNSRIKTGKPVKSNADLFTELREFVSTVGFPEGHVPSFKELSDHGRKDLAYIVRRRGYKLVTELLSNSTEEDNDAEISSAEKQKLTSSCDGDSVDQDQEMSELTEDLLSSSDAFNTGTFLFNENDVPPSLQNRKMCGHDEPGTSLSLLEKASKFIKDGELDIHEDIGDDINGYHDPFGATDIDGGVEERSDSQIPNNKDFRNTNNSVIEANASTSELTLTLETDSYLQAEEFNHARKDLGIQTGAGYNTHEIDNLKAMLHQKELELYQLKEEIEKEKLALSSLQVKAENEIGKAEKIMSTKDVELHTAGESLTGLKEVQIEYWGHGEIVEVAGSFNGWHHRIKMDSQLLRNSRVWSTVLWLYPGIYEIKFVVDGRWMTEPQMESITRGSIHNNILKVDR